MKKYFSADKYDPTAEGYDPEAKVVPRPLYSESEEVRDLRDRNFFLERELARYQNAEPKAERKVEGKPVTIPTGEGAEATDYKKTGELTIVTVPATEKAPSGGIISGGKVKAQSKSVAKRQAVQAKPKESVKDKAARIAAEISGGKKS